MESQGKTKLLLTQLMAFHGLTLIESLKKNFYVEYLLKKSVLLLLFYPQYSEHTENT